MRFLFAILLTTLLSLPAPPAVASPAKPPPYATLAAMEGRIAAIGFRLATGNMRWCPSRAPRFGWILGDPRLYSPQQWTVAQGVYGATNQDQLFVAALVPNGPAARAGLTIGTGLARFNGESVAAAGAGAFARIDGWETAAARLPSGQSVTLTRSDGTSATIMPVLGCASDFRLEAEDKVAAAADGRLILVNAGLVRFAHADGELAAAIAHEMAHNILNHPARLNAAGIARGLLQQFGRNARLTRQTEEEADRLSVWLLAGAGYDPDDAVHFWTRFGRKYGGGLFQSGTHPRWRDRVAAVTAEIATVRAARSADPAAPPPLIAAPPPLE